VAVSDLKTTVPLPGAAVQISDYQQQILSEGKTDANGMVKLHTERKPFLVTAKIGDHTGYLKMDEGSALSVSHFDVSGETVKKGIKGFIYGERGVWRPGDKIYLTFILLDTNEKKLPDDHPVTFELRNPKGQLVKTETGKKSVAGFYFFETQTDQDAPTGYWNAKIKVGGSVFEKSLKIETVMPNRLKIRFDLGEGKQSISEEDFSGVLSASWLHGAIAKNLKSDVEVTLSQRQTAFPKYKGYIFDDPAKVYQTEKQVIFEGNLDENGKAALKSDFKASVSAPGMLNADFKTRVFEPGGAFSTDYFSIPYHPYKQYVGISLPKGDNYYGMFITGKKYTANLVLVDTDGKPVPEGEVDVVLYSMDWRWWWERGVEQSIADFAASTSHEPVIKETIKIVNGEGKWNFEVKPPNRGRFLARISDKGGKHVTGQVIYIERPWMEENSSEDMPGGVTMLSFSSDKSEYTVGETVTLTIPTGKSGRGLVSIENGTRVVDASWVEGGKEYEGGKEQIIYEFTATKEMSPNIFAHVTFLQPHLQTENDLPIRMYGIIPIKIVDPETRLKPEIITPEHFSPEETAEITISESSGKAMAYTVAIVDEGLLDMTRFKTPDPWNHFYQREALGVKTWDLFDYVAGAYGGTLDKLLAVGGSDEGKIKGQRKANRFPPMVRFLGPFKLEKDQKQTHKFDIPQYIGSVRVMVIAGLNGSFGSEEKAVFVRKPLMILGTLPRVMGPDEEVELPVSVFAMEEKVKNVSLSLSAEGPISVQDSTEKSIAFSRPGDDMISFKLKADSKPGIGIVTLNASSGEEKVTQRIEFDVRMPAGTVTDVVDKMIGKGESWKEEIKFPGIAGTNKIYMEVSRIPPLNLSKRLNYLIMYPHGCVEQTTSSVFPQLYLTKLLELSLERKQEVERNIKAGIRRLQTFQHQNGGFTYWQGGSYADDWASSYAGHFLAEAEKAGYSVPQEMLNPWKEYQREAAKLWIPNRSQSELIQAYRLYTLALAGAPELGAMNRLRENLNLPVAARWQLAAAYMLAGQPEAAKKLTEDGNVTITPYRELANTYGSDFRDKAMVIETLCLMKEFKKAFPLVKEISERLGSDCWESTQTTAQALIAVARYTGVSGDKGDMKFTFAWNNGEEKTISSSSPLMQISLAEGGKTSGSVEIANIGDIGLYPRIITAGIPQPGTETAASNGLSINVFYRMPNGNTAINPESMEQGTDFVAEVTVKNTGTRGIYNEVALSHIVASGWEIHNERMASSSVTRYSPFKYQDIRDDRVYTYFDISQDSSVTFSILLNAAYLGKFYLPMIEAEAMYDATINARVPGKWINVKK